MQQPLINLVNKEYYLNSIPYKNQSVLNLILLSVFYCFLIKSVHAQTVCTVSNSYQIKSWNNKNDHVIEGLLPVDVHNRQRVIAIRFSNEDIKYFEENGNTYFSVDIKKGSTSFTVEYDIELFNHSLNNAKKKARPFREFEPMDSLKKYLSEESYENTSHKRLVKIANGIKGESDVEIAANIYKYIGSHLEYNNSVPENLGAIGALKYGKGDYTGFSELMVILCRIKGIPSRVVSGLKAKNSSNPNHKWVEIYFKEYGWVGIEPTKSTYLKDKYFSDMNTNYIYLNRGRQDSRMGHSNVKCSKKVASYFSNYSISFKPMKLMNLAYKYYNSASYDSAITILDDLLAFDNQNVTYITFKAMIYARQMKFEQANQLMQAALINAKHDYQKCDAYYAYANYLSLKGEYQNVGTFIKRAHDLGLSIKEHVTIDEDLMAFRATPYYDILLQELNTKSD